MLKFALLIWVLAIVGTPDSFSQNKYYCQEYDLRIDDRGISMTDYKCYLSEVKITRKKHIFMIETDSLQLRFGVLNTVSISSNKYTDIYHGKGSHSGTQSFAVIIGQPNQLYAIREEVRTFGNNSYYLLHINPIRQNERSKKPVSGHVLVVSTLKYCD